MSGLIYAAIVVAWAAYLVPLALRRHDEKVRARSVDRFSAAMRVLARRPDDAVAAPSGRLLRTEAHAAGGTSPRRRPGSSAARVAAARRRRVLIVLLGLTAAVAGVAAAGLLPWWSVAAPAALIPAFLAVCRRQVRRRNDAYWLEAHEPEPQRDPSVVVRHQAQAGAGDPRSPDELEAADEPLTEPQRVVAVALPTSEGESLWDPLPVTLPTYVTKPKVPRTVRAITLGEPGTWTSGRLDVPGAGAGEASGTESQGPPPQETEPRRAVGS